MSEPLNDEELAAALRTCAEEPIIIPGNIQNCGALVAIDPTTQKVAYASDNVEDYLGLPVSTLLGADIKPVVGAELWHGIKNALARPGARDQVCFVGAYRVAGDTRAVTCHVSGDYAVLEFEPVELDGFAHRDGVKTLRLFMDSIEKAETEDALFRQTCSLLRHVTGYHRVMMYRFDAEFNGEIVAEDRRRDMESFEGLRFLHWDIPAQARAMMLRLPLRFIHDTEAENPSLLKRSAELPALDISLAAFRGVSSVHMAYLRNMGVRATMTLTIRQGDKLWGMITLHHQSPRVPDAALREVLVNVAPLLSMKLTVLQQRARLELVARANERFRGAPADDETGEEALLTSSLDEEAFATAVKSADCLLVEDNFIIAKTVQDNLLSLGLTRCDIASDVESALDYLATMMPSFAVLDINLGNGQTSFPVAQRLQEMGVPFFFVTGYGDSDQTPETLKSVLRLTKPVTTTSLRMAMARMLQP